MNYWDPISSVFPERCITELFHANIALPSNRILYSPKHDFKRHCGYQPAKSGNKEIAGKKRNYGWKRLLATLTYGQQLHRTSSGSNTWSKRSGGGTGRYRPLRHHPEALTATGQLTFYEWYYPGHMTFPTVYISDRMKVYVESRHTASWTKSPILLIFRWKWRCRGWKGDQEHA